MMQEVSVEEVKGQISREVEALRSRLIEISHEIHAHPELKFEERRAAGLLTTELEKEGFEVERRVAGLETAFVATYGSGKPRVAFLAEYDALPGLGHACGHNLVAVWALGAGLAIKRALPGLDGAVQVIGTPAEEGGGGKVIMAEAGVFGGLDAAIFMHPYSATYLDNGALAMTRYTIEFFGKASHAATGQEQGISALDAVLQVFFCVNAMRQMMRPSARIHGNITHGGDAPNIIPQYAAAEFIVRAWEEDYLEELKRRLLNIVAGASQATGARSKVTRGISYKSRVPNPALIEVVRENMVSLGIEPEAPSEGRRGSSDLGDVSHQVPTLHPYFAICDHGISTHSADFAVAAASPRADGTVVSATCLLAFTGADVLLRPEVRERARADFRAQTGRDPLG